MSISEKTMLVFFIELLKVYPVDFPLSFGDPLGDAIRYISGQTDNKFFEFKRDLVWNYIESGGMLTDTHSEKALTARIALSMMPKNDTNDRAGDVYWMMLFLERYGHPREGIKHIASRHFPDQ
jgi:hypothetical protein